MIPYTFTALYFPSSTFRSTRSTSGSPELLKVMGPAALSKFLIWARASRTFLEYVVVHAFYMALAASLADT